MEQVGFEQAYIFAKLPEDKIEHLRAEVAGSNPTRSSFINLVIYGIELSLFLTIV
jgi:hypothetical protein